MNSQKAQIQALIGEIDEVLSKPSPRLPWVASMATTQQRGVLERVRSFLVSLEQTWTPSSLSLQSSGESLPSQPLFVSPSQPDGVSEMVSQQILQTVMAEMEYLRSQLTGSIHGDLEALRQEQQALLAEVKQLEARRQYHQSLAQQQSNQQQVITEFLQSLMNRLESHLTTNVSESLANLESRVLNGVLLAGTSAPELPPGESEGLSGLTPLSPGELPLMTPTQRLEQMRLVQSQCDRLLMTLDTNLSVVFEALQRNIKGYQESLSQGLDRMHNLGQQGEGMFAALVNHLAQELGREASSYIHVVPEVDSDQAERKRPLSQTDDRGLSAEFHPPEEKIRISEQEKYPYAGSEVPRYPLSSFHEQKEGKSLDIRERLEHAKEEIDDLYDRVFSHHGESVSRPESPLVPEEITPVSSSEEELLKGSLDQMFVAEDSEFVLNENFTEEIDLETQEFVGKTGIPEPQIREIPLREIPPLRPPDLSMLKKPVSLTNLFGEDDSEPIITESPPEVSQGGSRVEDWDTESIKPISSEDFFEQASPDENLLPLSDSDEDVDKALVLESSTLQILEEDLYSLEGLERLEGLDNFNVFSADTNQPFNTSTTSGRSSGTTTQSNREKKSTLDDLFADIVNSPPLNINSTSKSEEQPANEFEEIEEIGKISLDLNSDFSDRPESQGTSDLSPVSDVTLEDIFASLIEAEQKTIHPKKAPVSR